MLITYAEFMTPTSELREDADGPPALEGGAIAMVVVDIVLVVVLWRKVKRNWTAMDDQCTSTCTSRRRQSDAEFPGVTTALYRCPR